MTKTLNQSVAELHSIKVPGTELMPVTDLKAALDNEIKFRCRNKVTKRLALKLALAVISEQKGGMFYAERLATRIQARLKYEAALKEIYLESHSK